MLAIYSGDYYLFDTSDSELGTDDDQVERPTSASVSVPYSASVVDLSFATPPQHTSEQIGEQHAIHIDADIGEIKVILLRFLVCWMCYSSQGILNQVTTIYF